MFQIPFAETPIDFIIADQDLVGTSLPVTTRSKLLDSVADLLEQIQQKPESWDEWIRALRLCAKSWRRRESLAEKE